MARGDDDWDVVPMLERAIRWHGRVELGWPRWCRGSLSRAPLVMGGGAIRDGELAVELQEAWPEAMIIWLLCQCRGAIFCC